MPEPKTLREVITHTMPDAPGNASAQNRMREIISTMFKESGVDNLKRYSDAMIRQYELQANLTNKGTLILEIMKNGDVHLMDDNRNDVTTAIPAARLREFKAAKKDVENRRNVMEKAVRESAEIKGIDDPEKRGIAIRDAMDILDYIAGDKNRTKNVRMDAISEYGAMNDPADRNEEFAALLAKGPKGSAKYDAAAPLKNVALTRKPGGDGPTFG